MWTPWSAKEPQRSPEGQRLAELTRRFLLGALANEPGEGTASPAIDQLKLKRAVPSETDSHAAATLFYAIGRECFRRYVMDERESLENLEKNLFQLISAGYQGIGNNRSTH
jgi:hypothetical protein